jgi:hypothetical protein
MVPRCCVGLAPTVSLGVPPVGQAASVVASGQDQVSPMRRAISAAFMAGALALGGVAPAFAATTVGPGNGNPDTNPPGKCAPGRTRRPLRAA